VAPVGGPGGGGGDNGAIDAAMAEVLDDEFAGDGLMADEGFGGGGGGGGFVV
jgi:hypothetical protein